MEETETQKKRNLVILRSKNRTVRVQCYLFGYQVRILREMRKINGVPAAFLIRQATDKYFNEDLGINVEEFKNMTDEEQERKLDILYIDEE